MTAILVRKLLRDLRWALLIVALLLGLFQLLWAKITQRILGEIGPYVTRLASFGGQTVRDIEEEIFKGPGQVIRQLIGGEQINLEHAMDLLTIGYVHPLMQLIFCMWAIGRAAGAIAGELDRGTMELLLAQPLARFRIILAHGWVDLIVIPILCLSLWAGNFLGAWLVGPITIIETPEMKTPEAIYKLEVGKFKFEVKAALEVPEETEEQRRDRLAVHPWRFGRALWMVAGLMFAVSGVTLFLSAMGRFRWRVLSTAILIMLLQFLVNLLGQMWEVITPLRPFTLFYYYQPQQAVLSDRWSVDVFGMAVNPLVVLFGVGAVGYILALRVFTRRDLPAPL